MANQGLFTGGVKIRNLNGYLIAVNGEVFATTNTGGTTNAFFYQAKTGITSGDPGSGHLIWNNAAQISATQLNISHLTDTPIEDIDLFLAAITSGNKLVVQDRNDSLNYQSWTVSGTPTQVGSTYWTIPVTFLESSGTGTTGFANNHDLLFAIITGGAGGGGITTNAVTFNNSGTGAASGTSFNGATAVTVSYNTFGAQQASASLTSLAGLTYASTSFVKMTAAGVFALDTNTYLTANQTITLSGNVTGSGTTTISTTIANNVVTNAMLAQIATARIRGRVTAGTGNVEDLTGTQATTLLDTFTSALKGLAPASGGGTTNFLRADGTWAAPAGGGGTVTGTGTTNYIPKFTSSTAIGNSLIYDNGSEIGIGTTTPGQKLTVLGNIGTTNGIIESVSTNVNFGNISAGFLAFLAGSGVERMRITSGGDVGIGYTAPAAKLAVSGTTLINTNTNNGVDALQVTGSAKISSRLQVVGDIRLGEAGTGSSIASYLGSSADAYPMNINAYVIPGVGWKYLTNGQAASFAYVSGDLIYNNCPNNASGNDATLSTFNQRFIVTAAGNFGIGTYTAPAAKLAVEGTALINTNTDNGVDKLQVSGSAIATSLKVNTSGQTASISTYYNGGTGNNLWAGGGGLSSTSASFANTSFGMNALLNNTSGSNNTAIGNDALRTNTTGNFNTAVGDEALYSNTSGAPNDAFGLQALRSNTTGYRNVGFGSTAMYNNTTGYENIGIGHLSLVGNTTGYRNIGIGLEAGRYVSGGSANQTSNSSIYIGTDTRSSANGNTNEMVFGNLAVGQGSNTVTLGNSSITKTFLRGNTMVNTTTDNGVDTLQVNGSMIATSLKKSGGTSSQVLYADGGVKQITSGTAAPTGGNDGDIYLQYV